MKPLRPPARQALSRVCEAMATFTATQFNKAAPAGLKASDVKQVGSCGLKADTGDMVSPAALPEFVNPGYGEHLEKEPGDRVPPRDDAGYEAYVNKSCNLAAMASK